MWRRLGGRNCLETLELCHGQLESVLLAVKRSRTEEVVSRTGFVVHTHADISLDVVEATFALVFNLGGDESNADMLVTACTLCESHTVNVVGGGHDCENGEI